MTTLDPRDPVSKKQIKGSIADAIAREIDGSSRSDIVERVDKEYERLLAGAVVFSHIPSLTAGLVRRAEREFVHKRAAVVNAGAAA
jgi:hypothetical protein